MHSSKHLIVNALVGAGFLYLLDKPIVSLNLLVIVLAGFFIDLDHLFNQMVHGNLSNPDKMVRHWDSIAEGHSGDLYLFHTYEFIGLIGIAGFLHSIFFYMFIGLVLHFLCDALVNFKDMRSLQWLEDYSVSWYIYLHRGYPVFQRFFSSASKVFKPTAFIKLLFVYVVYVFTHPDLFFNWIIKYPILLIRWALSKL
jgi:hypothetical protein